MATLITDLVNQEDALEQGRIKYVPVPTVLQVADEYKIDPAYISAWVSLASKGDPVFKHMVNGVSTTYILRSRVLLKYLKEHQISHVDACSMYGLLGVYYYWAFGKGFRNDPEDLFDLDVASPYFSQLVRRLHKGHEGNIPAMLINHYFGGIVRDLKEFHYTLTKQRDWLEQLYFRWKEYYEHKGLWHPTKIS